MNYVKVSTKHGSKGMVTTPSGVVIGRVRKCRKDAAGTYPRPSKGEFYTAELHYRGRKLNLPTLGTRHKSKAHAARAIRLFWDEHAAMLPALPHKGHVLDFKSKNREVCGLDSSPFARVIGW